jgi:hypothetical protein
MNGPRTSGIPPFSPEMYARMEAMTRPGYDRWRAMVERTDGCEEPIRLIGQTVHVDTTTGQIADEYSSRDVPPGYILVPCGNRRASRCEPCSGVYKADTYHLVRAGLIGGKGVPDSVRKHPRVFVTLTAPSFGIVHLHRVSPDGQTLPRRPRRERPQCAHGRRASCSVAHAPDDPSIGQALCPSCYDYEGAVLWNAHSGDLWRRTTLYLRTEIAKLAGLSRKQFGEEARVSYVKVAEFQARGLIHFHAVIRIDGPEGPATAAPSWADVELITAAARNVIPRLRLADRTGGEPRRTFAWGEQLDTRPITMEDGADRLTEQAVSAYVAKYATKAAETTGTVDRRIRHPSEIPYLRLTPHAEAMITTAWRLGSLATYRDLQLRRWAHMLGYRGHFSTKSRAYSTTLRTLRHARAAYRAEQNKAEQEAPSTPPVARISAWSYAGNGYLSEGQALIAGDIRAERRAQREAARKVSA